MEKRRIGVREVAAHAGVSRQTVSRVLNDHPEVAEATRERVLRSMRDLDYRVNHAARALGTNCSRIIGVIASNSEHYGPVRSIAAVEAAAREAGYWVSSCYSTPDEPDSLRDAFEHLRSQDVDGIIAVAPHERTIDLVAALRGDLPTVMLHAVDEPEQGPSIDQAAGARLAVEHLIGAGHRIIAHVTGPPDWRESRSRLNGYLEALESHGLPPGPIIEGDWTPASGLRASEALADSDATAVWAANDHMALGLITGTHRRGLRVPEHLSVVGFDDAPGADCYWPALTTVRQDFDELGRRAVRQLLLGEPDTRPPMVPELIVRDSVSEPALPLR